MKHLISIFLLLFTISYSYSQPGWFQQTSNTNYNLRSIYFTDTLNGCAVGEYGTICITSDGGTTWLAITQSVDYTFNSVCFPKTGTGYVVGTYTNISENDAILFTTTNGGFDWTGEVFINQDGDMFLNSVNFINQNTGFAVGYEKQHNHYNKSRSYDNKQCRSILE